MDFPERIFFITTVTAQRKPLFRCNRTAQLFLDVLFAYRHRGIFQLYEFVVMPDHVHLLLAPQSATSLERAMQFIKGGYSHRHMKEPNQEQKSGSEASQIIASAIAAALTIYFPK